MGNESDQQATAGKTGLTKRIFYHPNFNVVIGILGTLLGIFGVYAYFASIKEPGLTYYVSPTRAAIVQKGNLNDFSVTFQGMLITNDLSSAEIQIWNQGKAPIHKSDILKPITLNTINGALIYKVIPTTTRDDIIGFETLSQTNGSLSMDWKILERNDGIKLQIIYGGSVTMPLYVNGVIEGQSKPELLEKNKIKHTKTYLVGFAVFTIIAGILIIKLFVAISFYSSPSVRQLFKGTDMFCYVIAAMLYQYGIELLFRTAVPPFGY